jgi:hypothetical protein
VQTDYVDHGMDKIEDPRLKSMILSSLTNTDSRWIIAYKIHQIFTITIWLLMNACTAGNLPDRDLHEFSKFPDDMKIRILERHGHGLIPIDEDLPTGSDDDLRVTAIRNMYSAGPRA